MAWEWLTPVVTGGVGVAGIAGSVWTAASARRSQLDALRGQAEAESRRAYRADKRVLYAKLLSELTIYVQTAVEQKTHKPTDQTPEQRSRYEAAIAKNFSQMITVSQLIAEVEIVGEALVADLARDLAAELYSVAHEDEDGQKASEVLATLIRAMRTDLQVGNV